MLAFQRYKMQPVKDRFHKPQSPDLITSSSTLSSPVASCDLARLRPLLPTAALLPLEACVAPSLLVLVSLPNARAKNICANKAEWVQPSNRNSRVAVNCCLTESLELSACEKHDALSFSFIFSLSVFLP